MSTEPFIEKIIFYQIISPEREKVRDLITLMRDVCNMPVLFAEKEAQLHSFLTPRSLTVFSQGKFPPVADYLYTHGYPFSMSFSEFCRNLHNISHLRVTAVHGEAVLAYLPSRCVRFYSSLFELYGYHTIEVESIPALTKALKQGINYVVFDQDMPGHRQKISETRQRVLDLLKHHRKSHPLFALSVIKDFDQGSLFNDIGSGTRDVVNIMLSPDEYSLFLLNYLSDFLMAKIQETLGEPGKSGGPLPFGKKGSRISFSLGMRDAKSVYRAFLDDDYHIHQRLRDTALDELSALQLKTTMTKWISDYLLDKHLDKLEKVNDVPATGEKITIRVAPEKHRDYTSKITNQLH